MEDKNVRDFNDVLIITVFFSFCFSLMCVLAHYQNRRADRVLNGYVCDKFQFG